MRILSGTFEGLTTGTPISLVIENADQRSRDYSEIKDLFRPGHADYTYWKKYGIRDYRGGGRASARETAVRVAAGAIARQILNAAWGDGFRIRGAMVKMGHLRISRENWDWDIVGDNPFWCPDATALPLWERFLDAVRKAGSSAGAVVEIHGEGVPAGLGEPVYDKIDADLAKAMMSINAVKAVEMGDGFGGAVVAGEDAHDTMHMEDGAMAFDSKPGRRHPGRHHQRRAADRALRRQADLVADPSAAHGHGRRGGDHRRHEGPARSLRRHPRRAGRRSHDGLRPRRPLAALSRAAGKVGGGSRLRVS